MSRGLGNRQRAILDYLNAHDVADVRTIVADIEGFDRWDIPESVLKSYQRAMRKLDDAGRVAYAMDALRDLRGIPRKVVYSHRYGTPESAIAHIERLAAETNYPPRADMLRREAQKRRVSVSSSQSHGCRNTYETVGDDLSVSSAQSLPCGNAYEATR